MADTKPTFQPVPQLLRLRETAVYTLVGAGDTVPAPGVPRNAP